MDYMPLKKAITDYLARFRQVISVTKGSVGHGLFIDNQQGKFSFTQEPLVNRLDLVNNDEDLGYAKTTLQSNKYIFNTWVKISRGNFKDGQNGSEGRDNPTRAEVGYSDNAIPSERDGFTYNEVTDTVSNDIDSYSVVGLISPEGFSDYTLDVTITSSSDWQSDPVGLIIGYVRDDDGTTHTLSVFRSFYPGAYGLMTYALNVHVDLNTIGSELILGTNEGLDWLTGEEASGGQYTVPEGKNVYNARTFNEFPNGVRFRIIRQGDIFTIKAGRLDDLEVTDASELILDLNDYDSTQRFKGASPYGYASLSQDNVSWKASQRPGNAPTVIDLRTLERHTFEAGEWTSSPVEDNTLKLGRLYFSPINQKAFAYDTNGRVRQLLSTRGES